MSTACRPLLKIHLPSEAATYGVKKGWPRCVEVVAPINDVSATVCCKVVMYDWRKGEGGAEGVLRKPVKGFEESADDHAAPVNTPSLHLV